MNGKAMLSLIVFAVLLVCGNAYERRSSKCPYKFKKFQNSCYRFRERSYMTASWTSANRTCAEYGAHLVTITSQAEVDFLGAQIDKLDERSKIWHTSGRYNPAEDKYYWMDGTNTEIDLKLPFWAWMQPAMTGLRQNNIDFYYSWQEGGYRLMDMMELDMRFICEKEL